MGRLSDTTDHQASRRQWPLVRERAGRFSDVNPCSPLPPTHPTDTLPLVLILTSRGTWAFEAHQPTPEGAVVTPGR